MKIAISTGHHPARPGKANGRHTEYSEMSPVAGLLVSWLQMAGHQAWLIGSGPLAGKVAQVNTIKPDCALELHLNGGGGKGCETLFCPGSDRGEILATSVHEGLIAICDFKDRGVKEGWYKMILPRDPRAVKNYFLEKTCCPAVICEPYFLDKEGALFVERQDIREKIARGIMKGLMSWKEEQFNRIRI